MYFRHTAQPVQSILIVARLQGTVNTPAAPEVRKILLSRSHVPSTSLEEVLEPQKQEAGDSQTGPSSSGETFLDWPQNVKKDLLVQASLCPAAGKGSYVKPRALMHNYLPATQGTLDE